MMVPASLSQELKQVSAALNRLNQRLQAEATPDPVVLLEFRQSLDNVRLTAWSVSELLNAQRVKRDPDHVFAFLSAERLRRLNQLVRNLCGDIDRQVITGKNYGMESLFDSVNALQQRLASCRAAEQQSEKEVSNAR
ncbi:MAG: hypothetical protein ACM3SW_03590 [Actinomycetota bacterium]